MVIRAYKTALAVLMRKPFVLWGLSLMSGLLTILVSVFCVALPIVSIPITLTLSAGMALIYLDGLREKTVNSDQLFTGFKKFGHVAGGMAWMQFWIFIWSLIPFVGPIIATVKAYSYAYTPYILMTRPNVSATEALRVSMQETYGKKGAMFLADLLFVATIFVASLVLILIGIIPLLGTLVTLLGFAIIVAFGPLVKGLVAAYFYEVRHAAPPVYQNAPYPGNTRPPQPPYGYPQQPQRPMGTQSPMGVQHTTSVNPAQTANPTQQKPASHAQSPVSPQTPAAQSQTPQEPAEQPD